jgi:hypothetical protein
MKTTANNKTKSIKQSTQTNKKDKIIIDDEKLKEFDARINKKLGEFNRFSEADHAVSFNQWLGGMMDSDGCFYLNSKNYLRCDITVPPREIDSLYKIKNKFGGSVLQRSHSKAFCWILYRRDLVKSFLIALNGNIYLKQKKYERVMELYLPDVNVKKNSFKTSKAWFSGFFEGDGHIIISGESGSYKITFAISQKDKNILEQVKSIYGGHINDEKSWEGYKWQAANNEDLLKLFEYFTLYPLQSNKNDDVVFAKQFFKYKLLGYHLAGSSRKQLLKHFTKLFQERKKISKHIEIQCL